MIALKIFRAAEWQAFEATGTTMGAPVDLADGYIHMSLPDQVAQTAAKWFAGEDGLMLLGIDTDALGAALKWEPSRGGALFPHLYRALTMADVTWVREMPLLADGTHEITL
ncbi:hypothetical protein AQS8620_03166 [Aquimixticola soesokkakensis]|uniref:Dihydroorotate dehydrogenase n=1 Tax=Aquimixticola soesokkakensis TaxID=1519096 RepID=A0A1Y5TQU6_9RHOB|nr:DUF952 domain-containing protein [Aquimixticola soesokkakensis]SLN67610.1 hypothetical protein AQS8620_03166 [Aquimixticola soesokkakensis]